MKRTGSGGYHNSSMSMSMRKHFDPSANVSHIGIQDMHIKRSDGVEVVIPACYFTKSGKVRKGFIKRYKALLGIE